MERRPTVLELVNSLRSLVNWTTFAQNLPQIKEHHIDKIKAENKDDIDEQKRALYNKWLAVYPEAKFSDVISALEKSERNDLEKSITEKIGGGGAKGEASGDVAGTTCTVHAYPQQQSTCKIQACEQINAIGKIIIMLA